MWDFNRSRAVLVGGVAVAVLLGACSGSDTVTSTPSTTGPQVSIAPPPVASTSTPSTAPATTAAPTTAAPTTAAPTTAAPTTAPPTTAPPTTAPPLTAPASPAPTSVVMNDGVDLIELDVATGEAIRQIVPFFNGDGIFRGGIHLDPTRTFAYFNEGYEDSWYACESSVGVYARVDVTSGEIEILGTGTGVSLSADGASSVHLDSDVCVPDPEAPELWVLTPYDRVVVTDLESGSTTEYASTPSPESYTDASAVLWAGLEPGGDLLVLTADETLRRIPSGATGAIQDHETVATGFTDIPVHIGDGTLLALDVGDEGSSDLWLVDLGSSERRLLASAEASMSVGVSDEGHIVATSPVPIEVQPGAPVTILPARSDLTYLDIDW